MSTFLELCQDVSRESGTVSGVKPTTVAGQTGRLLKIVNWTAEAWRRIQNSRESWRFMRKKFDGQSTVISQSTYTAANWGLTDFRNWVTDRKNYRPFTIYIPATGVSDEGPLREISYEDWITAYGRGTQTNNRPSVYALTPANEIALGAIPDIVYTVGGEYFRDTQVLAANDDVPICPVRFHQVIVWKAMMLLQEDGEDVLSIGVAQQGYRELMGHLEIDQLPQIGIGSEPIA